MKYYRRWGCLTSLGSPISGIALDELPMILKYSAMPLFFCAHIWFTSRTESKPHVQIPIVIPPLPFEFLWGVPHSDEAPYRRGETVYTFARKPADRYKGHYWIWYDFKTEKPRCSFDPPKSRDIPPAFLQQVVSSGKTSSPQSESSDFRMSHVSLSNAPNDEVCIAHGEPVSGDFKQFLENHPDMDLYDAKRKFKEEQKTRVRQGPKLH